MFPSATLCRKQEAAQNERAAAATLDNVRDIALSAAAAWAEEAGLAEKREARQANSRLVAAAAAEEKAEEAKLVDRSISENPDRSFAEAQFA